MQNSQNKRSWTDQFVLVLALPFLLALVVVCTFLVCQSAKAAIPARPGLPTSLEIKINSTISKMTLEEKVKLVGGNEFETFAIERLNIPAIKMADGPLGVRLGRSTAFPAGIAMGATFNPKLIYAIAGAIADETRAKGRHMLLGPCVNISRHPFGGRNFESFGEDPFLTGELAAEYVKGIQDKNVLASVKHLAANDQEFERMSIDVKVSNRALFEIHLPAFKKAVDAGSWTVMSSYNKINGSHGSENSFLQNTVLKKMWRFQGFVVSDWEATHSTIPAANNGLDLEMPTGAYFNKNLEDAVRTGRVTMPTLDDKIRRILRAAYGIGLLEPENVKPAPAPLGPETQEHKELALKAAQESIVLLKNDNFVLPLNISATTPRHSIAVIGPNAKVARTGGGGSSHVDAYEQISPLEGLQMRLGSSAHLTFALGVTLPGDMPEVSKANLRPSLSSNKNGLNAEYFSNIEFSGQPLLSRIEEQVFYSPDNHIDPVFKKHLSIRWSGFFLVEKAGPHKFVTMSDDGVRIFVDDQLIINNWTNHGTTIDEGSRSLTQGWHSIRIEYFQNEGGGLFKFGWEDSKTSNHLNNALIAAKSSDTAIIFAGLGNDMETEGADRRSMELPAGQVELIKAIAKVNPNTIVVLTSGNPLAMSEWIDDVKAVLQSWYPGQAGGLALADIILGHVNPSGKLPVSFLKKWEDSPAYGNYPGKNGIVEYNEGVFIGYRYFNTRNTDLHFPFGHGLSYTQFNFSNLKVTPVNLSANSPAARVEFSITNIGKMDGAEVAQVYVRETSPTVERPVHELKGFKKIWLKPGETRVIVIELDSLAFSFFDENKMSFVSNPGQFVIEVGNSSRQLPLSKSIRFY